MLKYVIYAAIFVLAACAVWYVIRHIIRQVKGKGGCSGDCTGCSCGCKK